MRLTIYMKICPGCGQVLWERGNGLQGSCPVCRTAWKMLPEQKIEVRLSL